MALAKLFGLRSKNEAGYRYPKHSFISGRKLDFRYPPQSEFIQSTPHMIETVPGSKELFERLCEEYHSLDERWLDPARVLHFYYLLEDAANLPEGDYIELGVHQGLTARLIYRLMDQRQTLYLLDTYKGFSEEDLKAESKIYGDSWRDNRFRPTSAEGVARFVGDGEPKANVKTIEGWFPDSFKGLEGRHWRFVHIDFDLYQPIRTALDMLWPNIVEGGGVVIHDYGCNGFPGAKLAVDEFAASVGLSPVRLGDHMASALLVKPKTPIAKSSG